MGDVFVKVQRLRESAALPAYMSESAAGADIFAAPDDTIVLQPGSRCLVPTGIAIQLPRGYEAQIRARSGLALKHGVFVLNGPGTIDADYRGEIQVLLANFSSESFSVTPKMRIAQMVIQPVQRAQFSEVPDLDSTARQTGGFGSTGS